MASKPRWNLLSWEVAVGSWVMYGFLGHLPWRLVWFRNLLDLGLSSLWSVSEPRIMEVSGIGCYGAVCLAAAGGMCCRVVHCKTASHAVGVLQIADGILVMLQIAPITSQGRSYSDKRSPRRCCR